ncbi:MAG: RelA/SpoT family protein [Rikenellaceae bacterium]
MVLQRYAKFREEIASNFSPQSAAAVDEALEFAEDGLRGNYRYDGSPLLDHAVGVANIVLCEVGLGRNSVIASIIHDVIRLAYKHNDEEALKEICDKIREQFGEQVLGIATSLSLISGIRVNVEVQQAAAFRDLIISYSSDPRVILIKLADRLEVMRSLEIFPKEKWQKKSWESLNLYAQIAHKLGLYNLKSELEDYSLKFLEAKDYNHIVKKLSDSQSEREAYIKEFIAPVSKRLDSAGVKYHIKSRTKSIYSIWSKMHKQNTPFESVYDIFAIRIIIECAPEMEKQQCWLAYSLVSDCYTPNPKRMRDWVSIPKSNGYESLHATVAANGGKWVEVQIRTERMDMVAERGIAAHWRYKGNSTQGSDEWLSRLRELIEDTTESIADRFDAKPTSSEIFVFTPNGDIRKLPKGATVLDFAFDIHTRVGSMCVGAKINERTVPMREELSSGDIVEIITQKNQTPKSDWLNIAITSKARNRIKYYLREEAAKSAKDGKEELERRIKNWKLNISIDEAVVFLSKYYKLKSGTEVYELIAQQRVEMLAIKELLQRHLSGEIDSQRRQAAALAEQKREARKQNNKVDESPSNDALIIDESINNIEYKLAKCCNPIKGDDVFGFVTISSGVTIHRKDCPNAARLIENYPYRVMEAAWRASATGAFRVNINIVIRDNSGVTNSVTEVISRELKLNMRGVSILSRADGTAAGTISVEVPNTQMVDMLIHSLQRLRDVIRVSRE